MEEVSAQPRPLGISILAVLHVLGGIGILAVQLFVQPRGVEEADQAMRNFGFTFSMAVAAFTLVAALGIVSGVGFWLGRPWGWWVGAFSYIYRAFASLNAILTVIIYSAELATESRGVAFYLAKYGGRIVVSLLILSYLLRPKTLSYFGLSELRRFRAIGKMVIFYLVLAFFTSLVGAIIS